MCIYIYTYIHTVPHQGFPRADSAQRSLFFRYRFANIPYPGILPDQMHLVHLTIAPDSIVSCLLDWTDSYKYVAGSTRNERLTELWENYRSYCEENGIGDRAQRKLFSVQTLTPDAPGFVEISQKKLNATAARYMIFWLANVAKSFALVHGVDDDMRLP